MEAFRRTVEIAASLFFGLVALLTLAGAASRLTFSLRLPDAYELACLAQGIAILWGIAIATYDGRHITVDLLYERLNPLRQKLMNIMAMFVSAVFLAFTAYMTILRGIEAVQSGLATNELRILVGPFWLLAGAGMVAAAILATIRLVKMISELRA